MKERLLPYLKCPACRQEVSLATVARTEGQEIMEGELVCGSGAHRFSIVRGIPRFTVLSEIEAEKVATASRFGWSWQHFNHYDERYSAQFLGWIAPVTPDFFKDKVVLEGGCGKGRHTQLAARWGARDVIGVDLSNAVETAFAWTRDYENAHIVQADIYNLPFARAFDYAFSVGVLHHLSNPRAGFLSLASKVKEQGHISAWVYGAENNAWITSWVDPVREKVTSQIGFGWREHHTIVFDHLVAPTAFYISREEFESWWQEIRATEVKIRWHNKNSWCGWGRLP
jgi:SAM-dependent methyltransferase